VIVALCCLFFGTAIFGGIACNISNNQLQKFDSGIMLKIKQFRESRSPKAKIEIEKTIRDITSLGGVLVISLITLFAFIFLLIKRQYLLMLLTLAIIVGGTALNYWLKIWFARSRPDELLHLMVEKCNSFPSGHSMLSAALYFSLAFIFAINQSAKAIKTHITTTACIIVFAVGLSRIYLGVHYPTDVLAGWSMGLAWAALWWIIGLRKYQGIDQKFDNA
jgi:undecaprenyl-diphosphatase